MNIYFFAQKTCDLRRRGSENLPRNLHEFNYWAYAIHHGFHKNFFRLRTLHCTMQISIPTTNLLPSAFIVQKEGEATQSCFKLLIHFAKCTYGLAQGCFFLQENYSDNPQGFSTRAFLLTACCLYPLRNGLNPSMCTRYLSPGQAPLTSSMHLSEIVCE